MRRALGALFRSAPFLWGLQGLTLELALRIHESFEKKFQFIVELEAGDERSHLVLGQWKDEIIALQGDDYGYSGRKPRVACRVDPERAVLRLRPWGASC